MEQEYRYGKLTEGSRNVMAGLFRIKFQDWQRPAITEELAFCAHMKNDGAIEDVLLEIENQLYCAAPWATYIDKDIVINDPQKGIGQWASAKVHQS